jgi:FKBP-type peptidyl-prolyl cis-trans isomerase
MLHRCLPLLLLGCVSSCAGARTTATETHVAPTSDTTSETTTEAAEPADDAEAPCTAWDPDADPTTAPLDVAAPPETSRRGTNGLRFCILRRGEGTTYPTADSQVRVHYTGWTTDGVMFDSSHTRGEPISLPVNGVIRGWTMSLTHMTEGQLRRVWIPEELAYAGAEGRPAGMLVFDIELVAIE